MAGSSASFSSAVWSDGHEYPLRVRILRAALVALVLLAFPVGLFFSWLSSHWMVALNLTESLDERIFLVERPQSVAEAQEQLQALEVGDRFAFRMGKGVDGSPYSPDTIAVKEVAGIAGETVEIGDDGALKIDGHLLGFAKEKAKSGRDLEWIEDGVIPEGHVFAWTPHPDSYDSRYADIGLVAVDRFEGRVVLDF